MHLETKQLIDGRPVYLVGAFKNLKVYTLEDGMFNGEEQMLFFVNSNSNEVVQKLFIKAGVSLNDPYIKDLQLLHPDNDPEPKE